VDWTVVTPEIQQQAADVILRALVHETTSGMCEPDGRSCAGECDCFDPTHEQQRRLVPGVIRALTDAGLLGRSGEDVFASVGGRVYLTNLLRMNPDQHTLRAIADVLAESVEEARQ